MEALVLEARATIKDPTRTLRHGDRQQCGSMATPNTEGEREISIARPQGEGQRWRRNVRKEQGETWLLQSAAGKTPPHPRHSLPNITLSPARSQ